LAAAAAAAGDRDRDRDYLYRRGLFFVFPMLPYSYVCFVGVGRWIWM